MEGVEGIEARRDVLIGAPGDGKRSLTGRPTSREGGDEELDLVEPLGLTPRGPSRGPALPDPTGTGNAFEHHAPIEEGPEAAGQAEGRLDGKMTEIVGEAPWMVVDHELDDRAVGAGRSTSRDRVVDPLDDDVHGAIVPRAPGTA